MLKMLADVPAFEHTDLSNLHYVIVGGDWNQFPFGFTGLPGFPIPAEYKGLTVPETYPAEGWKWAKDMTVATNRSLNEPFNAESTDQKVIDFFLVSPNVEIKSCQGVDQHFKYSDHQPVKLEIEL